MKKAEQMSGIYRALAVVAFSVLLLVFGRGGRGASAGDEFDINVTVVPNDARDLDCDSPTSVGGSSCAFSEGRRVSSSDHALRPFVTTTGELVVLADVFSADLVAAWLRRAREARTNERVELACRVRRLGTFEKVGVRFRHDASFEPQQRINAAKASSCRLREHE
jgi:hypothetical protein